MKQNSEEGRKKTDLLIALEGSGNSVIVEIDLKECGKKTIGYWGDRVPELFAELSRDNQ